IVAIAAGYARVSSIQRIPSLRMIETCGRRRPVDNREVLPVVIGVALHTRRTRAARLRIGGMQAFVLLQLGCDLAMALETLKRPRPYRCRMAARAVAGPAQRLVRARQRSGRNLRRCRAGRACNEYAHNDGCD